MTGESLLWAESVCIHYGWLMVSLVVYYNRSLEFTDRVNWEPVGRTTFETPGGTLPASVEPVPFDFPTLAPLNSLRRYANESNGWD